MKYQTGDYYRDFFGDLVKVVIVNEKENIVQVELLKNGITYWVKTESWLVPISSLEKALL